MMDPLTIGAISEQLDRLATNFPRGKGAVALPKLAELWRDELRGVTPDAFRFAVRVVIQDDGFFPKVSRIREAAKRYTMMHPTRGEAGDPLFCRGCQSRSRWEARWRPVLNPKGRPVVDDKGRLALETFQRYQCECSSPSQWMADSADDPFMTPRA